MAAIFGTSCTVITTEQWTQMVLRVFPHLTEEEFRSFWGVWWFLFVKGYHVTEFVLLTVLLNRAFRGRSGWAVLAALAYAATDEFHQTFIPHRGGRFSDWVIDAVAVGIGYLLICRAQPKPDPVHPKPRYAMRPGYANSAASSTSIAEARRSQSNT